MIIVITVDPILEGFDDFQLITNKKSSKGSRDSNFLLDATNTIDCYLSQLSKSESTLSNSLFVFLKTADKKKKIRVRLLTPINPENIQIVKELARQFSVYHTDAPSADFCIIDGALYFYDIENSNNEMAGYQRQDRKSTRLNSSHTVISYAVF